MRYDYDLAGKRFGKLVVIKHAYVKKNQNWWECKCDCGNTTIVKARRLGGETKSCGCLRRERIALEPYQSKYNLMVRCNKIRKGPSVIMSFNEFKEFTKIDKCHYCGMKITWHKYQYNDHRKNRHDNGYYLDRKNNALGYVSDNCVVCCSLCNMVKGKSLTYDEMLIVGKSIAEVHKKRATVTTDCHSCP